MTVNIIHRCFHGIHPETCPFCLRDALDKARRERDELREANAMLQITLEAEREAAWDLADGVGYGIG